MRATLIVLLAFYLAPVWAQQAGGGDSADPAASGTADAPAPPTASPPPEGPPPVSPAPASSPPPSPPPPVAGPPQDGAAGGDPAAATNLSTGDNENAAADATSNESGTADPGTVSDLAPASDPATGEAENVAATEAADASGSADTAADPVAAEEDDRSESRKRVENAVGEWVEKIQADQASAADQ